MLDREAGTSGDRLAGIAAQMGDTLCHRGPDDHGVWADPAAGVAFGHRRLSIIDLSAAGHQPMVSRSGRYVITYNGEIYNHADLRSQLLAAGTAFRGHSDTEVLLAGVERWGLRETLQRLNGMFAFGLWDTQRRHLHLARDRLGEKPLYYGWLGASFVFASQLRAIRAHPAFRGGVDRGALALFLRHNCVPAPYSIHPGIWKLPPGSLVTVSSDARDDVRPEPYWDLRAVSEEGLARPLSPENDLVGELDDLLRVAVRRRIHADVPVGAFLSGGIDSSLIVALMQSVSTNTVRTFTIGFDDPGYDESADAAAVAAHLGTDHLEYRVSARETLDVVPMLPGIYDEPFADSSQIPTFLVSRLARDHVTVALTGDGGDEFFGGYNRYAWAPAIWRRATRAPRTLRSLAATALDATPPRLWAPLFRAGDRVLPPRLRVRIPDTKIPKVAALLRARDLAAAYTSLVSHWKDPGALVLGAREPDSVVSDRSRWPHHEDPAALMMYLDAMTYLPDDILTKLDRASMAVSLEGRVPYLDHEVVEYAWRLPPSMKVSGTTTKWILREVLARYVPARLFERPKMGFGLPVGAWLRGPLRAWAEELLTERRLRDDHLLDPAPVRRAWGEHLSGRVDRSFELWDVLMFQAWLESLQAAPAGRSGCQAAR